MAIERILLVLTRLIEFWQKQNITILAKTKQEINQIEKSNFLNLPNDFKEFYQKANGMVMLYPNEFDEEGFLFYPIDVIQSVSNEFEHSGLVNRDRIFIFADYMHKSWWYGYELIDSVNYVIGIIPDKDTFKPITNSLEEFIELYIENSPRLYDYS